MEFRTEIPAPASSWKMNHSDKLMFIGSCFAENIGQHLTDIKVHTMINPFGVMFNPVSLADALARIAENRKATDDDFIQIRDLWASFNFHGMFSGLDKGQVEWSINNATEQAHAFLRSAQYLTITLGTAWVYVLNETGKVVANCHKVQESNFTRRRLSVEECTDSLTQIARSVRSINPKIKIIISVSPIRHWKEGAHENQLSKSILMLAAEEFVRNDSAAEYFPAYEYLMDDLRDYRFYKKNLINPNGEAVEYIWQKFRDCYFSREAANIAECTTAFIKAANHRPFNRLSESHQQFLRTQIADLKAFHKQYPYIDFNEELHLLQAQLR